MNRTPAAPTQNPPQAQSTRVALPNFLHVAHNGPVDLEAYLHRYVDDLARAEFELGAGPRSA
ncbi:MAG TPA: hypothetical protein VFA75_03765 [Nevskia sp.]|nr:hypothetical protein [Nevskia sp.]